MRTKIGHPQEVRVAADIRDKVDDEPEADDQHRQTPRRLDPQQQPNRCQQHRDPGDHEDRLARLRVLDADQAAREERRSDVEHGHKEADAADDEQCRNDPQPERQWDVGARADRWLRRRSDLGHSPSALAFPVGCCYRRVAGSGRGWTPYGPRDTALARVSSERPAGRLTDPCET
jgi:hypothetical protein